MRGLPLFALLTSLAFAEVAQADPTEAVTYGGKLGTLAIVLELAAPPVGDGHAFGRYADMARGIDIPLHGLSPDGKTLRLEEEAPCTQKTCIADAQGTIASPPIAADWMLQRDGLTLSGTRTDRATGRALPVRLEHRAARAIDIGGETPLLDLLSDDRRYEPGKPDVLDPRKMPYDFLKLDGPREVGEETRVGPVLLRMETDTRNGVSFPVAVALGGGDTGPINAYLSQQRLQAELPYLGCSAKAYAGFGWTESYSGTPSDGAPPEEDEVLGGPSVGIDHVSPRLLGISQADSFFCGAAHPNNYLVHFLADARTGAAITPETLLAGWNLGDIGDPAAANADETASYGPSNDLVAYVQANRLAGDSDCDIDALIANPYYLGVYFTQNDLVFTLRDLPFAITACAEDVLSVPLAEARALLTPEGARYFAALDR